MRLRIILVIFGLLAGIAVVLWGAPKPQRDQFATCQAETGPGGVLGCMQQHGYVLDVWRFTCLIARGRSDQRAACYSPVMAAVEQ